MVLRELSLGDVEISLRLINGALKGARVDVGAHLTLGYLGIEIAEHVLDDARHVRTDGDGENRIDGPRRGHCLGHRTTIDSSGHIRDVASSAQFPPDTA